MTKIEQEALSYILDSIKNQPSESFESEKLEFKNYKNEKSFLGDNELIKEISAFANHKGGTIVIGVVDSSNIKNNHYIEQLNGFFCDDYDIARERIKGKIEPRHEIEIEEFEHENKYYTVIHIPKAFNYLVGTTNGKFCMRDGKSSVPMTSLEIERAVKNLHNFDWTDEIIEPKSIGALLDPTSIKETKKEYCDRRSLNVSLPDNSYFESIGVTKNGHLTRGGLLFLGKKAAIKNHLGNYEYRYSRKTKGGKLLTNDVWSDNIWNSIKRAKSHFKEHNASLTFEYKGTSHSVNRLDEEAFHEAYLNGIVHRDYTLDGMTIVNFMDDELRISNPGKFYGGVTEENIGYHEPRHRNKCLANILMEFQFIDRAGMGVLRMGLGSLKYGRSFPEFKEKDNNIIVTMQSEYFRPTIFLLSTSSDSNYSIEELLTLNLVYERGFVKIDELVKLLQKISRKPWDVLLKIMSNEKIYSYLELCGTNDGLYIRVIESALEVFNCKRIFKVSTNSDKHVKLYKYLKQYGSDSNKNLTHILEYSQSSSTSKFLKNAKYVESTGDGRSRKWSITMNNGNHN